MINGNEQAIGFEGDLQKGWSVPGVPHAKNLLRHFQADACVYDEVKPLFDASTVEYTATITLGDDSWSYEEDSVLKMAGRDELLHHTDRNTLSKVADA